MNGIVSYGVYVPYWRLQRSAISAALGSGGGKGSRAVASYDQDTTALGVEAARVALAQAPAGVEPTGVWFSTTEPAYLDKTNANAIHAALALSSSSAAIDVIGSVRSGEGARFVQPAAILGSYALGSTSDCPLGWPRGALPHRCLLRALSQANGCSQSPGPRLIGPINAAVFTDVG